MSIRTCIRKLTRVVRSPVFGNEVLERYASHLSHRHIAIPFNYDLQQPHQMLGRILKLQENTPTINTVNLS